ncbi:MAG: hypothetical protein J6S49_09565 [Erysipelotrichaceae bacterium]|nr:hypothetical protein [Erysipelotrichaceae bacterium]
MKKIVILLMCLIMCSCASRVDIQNKLDEVFAKEGVRQIHRKNNYSDYIDYYVPSDIQEVSVDALSSSYEFNNARLVFNINVSGIISSKYYPDTIFRDEGFFDPNRLVYQHEGEYLDSDDELNQYRYSVYQYDERYLTYFLSKDLIFYGYCDEYDLVGVSTKILMMAKAANVKDEDVVANYSSKDVIDFEKKQVNLFETIMPVNGNINDFLISQDDSSAE